MAKRAAYEAVFASVAVEFFVQLSKRRQRKLLDRVQELTAGPFLVPDFLSRDAAGRDISHFMTDGFIFDYWVDHPAKQVIVTRIEDVE